MNENPGSPQPSQRRRAKLILLLGITSYSWIAWSKISMGFGLWQLDLWALSVLLVFLICLVLGLTTIGMAWECLRPIPTREADKTSQRLAGLGAILGTVSIVLLPVGFVALSIPDYLTTKEAMTNDIDNIHVRAYIFRLRPTEMGGGCGSYVGFTIPPKMAINDNGQYTVFAVHKDTIRITGVSTDGQGSTVAYMDSSGRLFKWEYRGIFKEEYK